MAGNIRIGIDIGGTFTDFTFVDSKSGVVRAEKLLTSVDQAERAVLDGLDKLTDAASTPLSEAAAVIHATTLVTNTILERKGALTGLLATQGFSDILEIQREVRYDIYDMFIRLPQHVVPRRLRIGVAERLLADGSVRTPLDETGVRDAAAAFRAAGVEAVAVVFLHSYRNPDQERRAAEILREELPGVVVSVSHEVFPEPKEYERSSTTVLDAYVKRVVEGYLDRFDAGLKARGYDRTLLLMLSNGGTTTAAAAKKVPIELVESGPAAGVEAAGYFGRLLGIDRVLSFDMGGTTAKLCIVENGQAAKTREFEVDRVQRFKEGSGLPCAVPVYDLLEIGAGGGSIARINDLGLVQVGPDSAGAMPGPACYGGGGELPTVTDADLVLGHLDEASFLGGEMALSRSASEIAFATHLAGPAGMSVDRAARGVFDIVNDTMASAARQYLAEKGRGPSEMTMIAFGGAGPVHAVGLARQLGCPRVVIPPLPGVMSSLGLLVAPVAFERTHAVRALATAVDTTELSGLADRLAAEARALMPAEARPVLHRTAGMRYSGQDYALEVSIPDGEITADTLDLLQTAFVALYHEQYGKVDDDTPIEIATITALFTEMPHDIALPLPAAQTPGAPSGYRRMVVSGAVAVEAPVYQRRDLMAGQSITGPAVVEERESTAVIDQGDVLTVHPSGALVIDVLTGPAEDTSTTATETLTFAAEPEEAAQ